MTPSSRTTHQRDRRFARVRLLTRSIFVGSSVLSVGMIGYLSSVTKLHTTALPHPSTTVAPTTTTPAGATGATGATGVTGAAAASATTTTTVPVTTTTTCYTSPSGNTVCN